VQFACMEPSFFASRTPMYELMLFGNAAVGSAAYAANLTCPSAGSQVSYVMTML
jgi:hypothetical protein